MDTQEDNDAFRSLMKDMGLAETKGSGIEVNDAVFTYVWKSGNYDWDRETWEGVKDGLKERGKWPL